MASADWRWCCAPQAVQRLWQTEGVDGPSDLATLYTSAAEVRADLQKRGLADEDVNMGMLAWSDAPRAMASLTTRPRVAVPAAVAASSTTTRTSRKRVRTSSTKRAPGGRVADEQGFGEIDDKIFEEVWRMVLDAGPHSDLYSRHSVPGVAEMARTLFLRPLRRFRDSIRTRLTVWRRWCKWMQKQHATTDLYMPSDLQLGAFLLEVSQTGPTAASSVWHQLRWWDRQLSLGICVRNASPRKLFGSRRIRSAKDREAQDDKTAGDDCNLILSTAVRVPAFDESVAGISGFVGGAWRVSPQALLAEVRRRHLERGLGIHQGQSSCL